MKRSRLTWWEDATIAVCVWLATWLGMLQLPDGSVRSAKKGRA